MLAGIAEGGKRESCSNAKLPSLAIALSFLGGCGVGSGTGRIPVGSMATAQSRDDASVPIFFSGRTDPLPVGTRVKVLADQEGDPEQPRRKVVVGIQSGPSKGLAGQMYRSDLRPAD